jgi:hypothetical protein
MTTTTVQLHSFVGVGAIVTTTKSDRLFQVIKVNPKNLLLVGEDGRQYNLDKRAAVLAPLGTEFSKPTVDLPEIKLGTLVRFTGNTALRAGEGLYVCTQLPNERGQARFALLGGTPNNSYWRVNLANIEIVDPATVLR